MSSAAIIDEILHLPPAGQAEVIQFALRLARERALAPDELARLAQRIVDSDDLTEVEKLKPAIMRGFPTPAPAGSRHPLRGTPVKLVAPTEPVADADWAAAG